MENGVVMFEDEVFFQQSGSTHRTYAFKGKGVIVKSEPVKRSIKAFGAVSDEADPSFFFKFAPVFNQDSFQKFLSQIINRFKGRKVFMILDNVRYHHARKIREWLEGKSSVLELHFLPAYSPNLNPIEKVWKKVKKESVHNKHFSSESSLKQAVFKRFNRIQGNPASIRELIKPNLLETEQ
jgi:transposase